MKISEIIKELTIVVGVLFLGYVLGMVYFIITTPSPEIATIAWEVIRS